MMSILGPEDGHIPGNILAALCKTPDIGAFHWIVYLCEDEGGGTKFHAHNRMGAESWKYERQGWNAMDSQTCVALTKIGRLPPGLGLNDIDAVLKDIPMAVPDAENRPQLRARFTCLVWFREALRRLDSAGIIGVRDLDRLEDDLRTKATAMDFRRAYNLQPKKPVVMRPSDYTY